MNVITVVVLIFSIIGALDKLFGNKLGMGKEFDRAFSLFTPMASSMLGILAIAPAVGVWLQPVFEGFYRIFGIDPSIIPASLFANDMGGMTIAREITKDPAMGNFNAYVISSMMGCVISFTIPVAISMVKKEQHKELFFGFLCGIVTVPVGGFVAGLICGLAPLAVFLNLLPLIILSAIIAAGLALVPNTAIKIFSVFGWFMRAAGILGLIFSIFTFLTKIEINPHFGTLQDAAMICVNACITLTGMMPLMYLVKKLLNKPAQRLSEKMGINSLSAVSFLANLVSATTILGTMDQMNKKGVALNAAFAVSAAFVFGSHLAFTMAFDSNYLLPMMVGKLLSGVCAVALAMVLYKEKTE